MVMSYTEMVYHVMILIMSIKDVGTGKWLCLTLEWFTM